MKPRSIALEIAPVVLALLIRCVGLVFLFQFAVAATRLVTFLFSAQREPLLAGFFWEVICNAALALWFVCGAPPVADVAYPPREAEPEASLKPAAKCSRCERPLVPDGAFCPYCGMEQPSA